MEVDSDMKDTKSSSGCTGRKCLGLLLGIILVFCFVVYMMEQNTPILVYEGATTAPADNVMHTGHSNHGNITAGHSPMSHENQSSVVMKQNRGNNIQMTVLSPDQKTDQSTYARVEEPPPSRVVEPSSPRVAESSSPRVAEPPPSRDAEPSPLSVSEPSAPGRAHPFPKMVLMLAYHRVGSSFSGSIFDNNPNMFYIYEPLDAVYSRLYGTKKGWAVPMDIHFNWDRTYREMPPPEKDTVSRLMEQILTCDFDHMISEYLVNEFWTTFSHKQAHSYVDCLKHLHVGVTQCQRSIWPFCPGRVGENLQQQSGCAKQLSSVYGGSNVGVYSQFTQYKQCMDNGRQKVMGSCISHINSVCREKKIHVIKTVRLEADTIEELKAKYPELKIIHLVRDPRAVVLSRIKTDWATLGSLKAETARRKLHHRKKRSTAEEAKELIELADDACEFLKDFAGIQEENDQNLNYTYQTHFRKLLAMPDDNFSLDKTLKTVPETDFGKVGQLYCYLALKDKHVLHGFEKRFPGTVYELVYENLVSDPQGVLENVYDFIDEPIPVEVRNWLKSNTGRSKKISQKWKNELDDAFIKDIDQSCHELYKEMNFVWPT